MSNQFLLIIKKQGEDNFRFFKNGKFNKAANEILKKNDSKYVWGIHKGIIDNSIWGKIRKNDKIYPVSSIGSHLPYTLKITCFVGHVISSMDSVMKVLVNSNDMITKIFQNPLYHRIQKEHMVMR